MKIPRRPVSSVFEKAAGHRSVFLANHGFFCFLFLFVFAFVLLLLLYCCCFLFVCLFVCFCFLFFVVVFFLGGGGGEEGWLQLLALHVFCRLVSVSSLAIVVAVVGGGGGSSQQAYNKAKKNLLALYLFFSSLWLYPNFHVGGVHNPQ